MSGMSSVMRHFARSPARDTLPSGYVIPVRLADEVNSSHDKAGELFTGTVDPSVLINNHVVIPRGTEAHIRMVEAKKGGRSEERRVGKEWRSRWSPYH